VMWFELRYETFVPRHTGNVRVASYLPIAYALFVAAGVELACRLVMRWWGTRGSAAQRAAVGAVVTGLAIAFFATTTVPLMASRPEISSTGAQALAELKKRAPQGSVVVSNVATRGTFEYFTGLEAPTEGRQPLIEERRTLASAIKYLLSLHRFLEDPRPGQLQRELGATWFVLARNPRQLGTGIHYGLPAPSLARKAGLELVWQRDGISILRAPVGVTAVDQLGPRKTLWSGYLTGLSFAGVVVALAARLLSRIDRLVSSPRRNR
jgi:hypothetical protein